MIRRVAIGIPARNEAARIGACLASVSRLRTDDRVASLEVVVLANNCSDETASIAGAHGAWCKAVTVDLAPDQAHAGWARRKALDAAANRLRAPGDLLMSTDADTTVDADWLLRTLDHLDHGWDAVAGVARLAPAELRGLELEHRRRLALIQRHDNALTRLKAAEDESEPWPRHFYEGGASIALTLATYRRIGGAPTPPVAEDKALFEAVRNAGGSVRHATDARVWTSARLVGRASGGASDTLARWGRQEAIAPIEGVTSFDGRALTFSELPGETARARAAFVSLKPMAVARDQADTPLRIAGSR